MRESVVKYGKSWRFGPQCGIVRFSEEYYCAI